MKAGFAPRGELRSPAGGVAPRGELRSPAGGFGGTPERPVLPFRSAQQAWFWTRAHMAARAAGRSPFFDTREGGVRPCEPDDIVRHLAALHEAGRITLDEARVLARFGDMQRAPDAHQGEKAEAAIWRRVMRELDERLRQRGIVVRDRAA